MPCDQMDVRQLLLAGVALLLILAHLFSPTAGVDDTSVLLLIVLAIALYGGELTAWLAAMRELAADPPRARSRPKSEQPAPEKPAPEKPAPANPARPAPEPRPDAPEAEAPKPAPAQPRRTAPSELASRIRQVSYMVEHARVAATTEDLPAGHARWETITTIVETSAGQPRAALLMIWSALDERLRASTSARDGVAATQRLVDGGVLPAQFGEAFDAFRKLRMEIVQEADGQVSEAFIWSMVDLGASLLALIPPRPQTS